MLTSRLALLQRLGGLSLALTGCWACVAHADATMVYEMTDAAGDKSQYTFTIVGRFVRVDGDKTPKAHWLYDSGFRKLYHVDDEKRQYRLMRVFDNPYVASSRSPSEAKSGEQPPAAHARPELTARKEKKTVAGVRCRLVTEKRDGQVVAQHCMAGTGPLGISKREVYTLSRLFMAPGRLQFGWPGVATSDELFACVQSQTRDGKQALELKSISHDTVMDERMRVPKTYRNLDAPVEPAPQEQPDAARKS